MTYTVLAVDAEAGYVGAATASRSQAVGNSTITVDPALGVVCSQAWTNRHLRSYGFDRLVEGMDAEEIVRRLPEADEHFTLRQFAVMNTAGQWAAHTGTDTSGWAGSRGGTGFVVLGNCLVGPWVLDAMAARVRPAGSFDQFVLNLTDALVAGDRAGGDRRGRQSAAIVAAHRAEVREFPPLLQIDLRVDDDPEDPVGHLVRMVEVRLGLTHPGRDDQVLEIDPAP